MPSRLGMLAGGVCVFLLSLSIERINNPPPASSAPLTKKPPAPHLTQDTQDITLTRPKGITSPFTLQQARHVYDTFSQHNRTAGLTVTELHAALPAFSVTLSMPATDLAHRDFDLNRDELLSVEELLQLINHERSNLQRCWRMIMTHGWIFLLLLIISNALCISWVEGRMFASVGAYSRYLEMSSAKQRAWDSKRASFMSPGAFRERITWYLINYIGGAVAVGAILYSSGSLDIDIIWWFMCAITIAPFSSWLLLRAFDWIWQKQKRVLHKRRLGSSRMKHSQRKWEKDQKAKALKAKVASNPVVGGSKRAGRTPRAEVPLRRELIKQELKAKALEVTESRAALRSQIDELKQAMLESNDESLNARAKIQVEQLEQQVKALVPTLLEVDGNAHQSSQLSPMRGDVTVVQEMEKQLTSEIEMLKQRMKTLSTPNERASAQKRLQQLQSSLEEIIPELAVLTGENTRL